MAYAGGMVDEYTPSSGNEGYTVTSYDLTLDYKVMSNRLTAVAEITVIMQITSTNLTLDLRNLRVAKVSAHGASVAKFAQTDTKLKVSFTGSVLAGSTVILTVRYGGNPKPNRSVWGEVGWEELEEGLLVASQPDGASSWFPCNDHPSNKAKFRFDVTADSPFTVIANGQLTSKTVKSSRTRWVYESQEPMATYLATLQLGQFTALELPHDSVPMHAFIPADLRAEVTEDFGSQQRMLSYFEECFGPYPFEQYTVVVVDEELEIPLESQGISVFGRNHADGNHSEDRLIAHELAHTWFGNSLTVSEWKHIWLHEGFACYAEWLWSEHDGGLSADALARSHWKRLSLLPQDLLLSDPGPSLMFDDRIYKRGALLLHALRLTMGDQKFFMMLRAWTGRHNLANVTTGNFLTLAREFGGADAVSLVLAWLNELPLPELPTPRKPHNRLGRR